MVRRNWRAIAQGIWRLLPAEFPFSKSLIGDVGDSIMKALKPAESNSLRFRPNLGID